MRHTLHFLNSSTFCPRLPHALPSRPRLWPARLDHVADPRALTDKLLEVLPVCPEELKKDAITFLPEVATEDDHEVGTWAARRPLLGGVIVI